MSLRRTAALSVSQGVIGTYMHNSISEGLGKIGVLVALESSGDTQELAALGRLVAMHIAATCPLAVDSSGLGPDVIERETGVLADKAKASGKPDNVIEKIVESGLKSFYKEVCLLDQPYVHDDKKNVAQSLKEAEGKVGGPIKVTGFIRYKLGEGIEKQDNDFAAEVAAAAGKS
jgi:elongation factor Ts